MTTGILIGAGQRGMDVYAAYALRFPTSLRIVAVAEPDEARRHALQQRHAIPDALAFANWQALLAQPKLADSALVCTQDRDHAAPVKAALAQGYHVLCEKPMSPNARECVEMANAAQQFGKSLTVCHVLRYAPFYTRLKAILAAGTIGTLVSVQHIECVGYWHQAHSFVRGNWRSSAQTSPMILAKSCHDLDILSWLIDAPCQSVSSYGSLKHFRPENAPKGSAERCFDGCTLRHTCPYDCGKLYLQDDMWYSPVIRKVVAAEGTQEAVAKALQTGPYGRCVYHCDNDVVDHQIVNLQFDGDVTVSFTMCAFTYEGSRVMNLMGTRGQIKADMEKNTIEVMDFLTGNRDSIKINAGVGGHSGSDDAFMRGFLRTVETDGAVSLSPAQQSMDSHLIALAAEESRVTGQTIAMEQFKQGLLAQRDEATYGVDAKRV